MLRDAFLYDQELARGEVFMGRWLGTVACLLVLHA